VAGNYYNLGGAWFSKGEYDKAIDYYEKNARQYWTFFFEPTHFNQKTTSQSLSRAANDRGMELSRKEKYRDALG
jgi:tetratricopeptide (TPR) repeat protein